MAGGQAIERFALLAQVGEVAKRKLRERDAVLRGLLAEGHHAIRLRERQRLEQHRVDDAEDGGVGADAERQGKNRDRAIGGLLPQHARAVGHVSPENLQEHARTPS
jgi:hypothetical protein